MRDRIYLLSIGEFLKESQGAALMDEAMSKVDVVRREKAARIRQPRAKAACLGAGLLLQLAVRNYIETEAAGRENDKLATYTIHQLLQKITDPIPLELTYGSSGKPYFKEYPIYFNLSHSGEYVVCAVSDREIGVDIQEHKGGDTERIAKRYFSGGEIRALDTCEEGQRTKLFFDLWAAKEAYGKYTGGGITESLEAEIPADRVIIQQNHSIPGYSLAVCKGVE